MEIKRSGKYGKNVVARAVCMRVLLAWLVSLLSACAVQTSTLDVVPSQSAAEFSIPNTVTPTGTPFWPTRTAGAIASSTATSSPSPTSTPSSTPDPYYEWTIDYLSNRGYGGGELQIHETIAENSYFNRYTFSYPSDGLTIFGFMNVPKRGEAPYPVVIALHGYIDPEIYVTMDYTTGYADALARAGYFVLHPNLRGYPPSDDGDNTFRVGMALDVLNLLALVREYGGQPGPLELADPTSVGLWGHSMGGGVATRVVSVDVDIRAVVLYGAMSSDEKQNFEAIYNWSNGERGQEEISIPEAELVRISPIYFLDRIQAAVSVHHGEADGLVPLKWSLDMCDRLEELGKMVECYSYPGQPHTFFGEGEALFNQRVIEFFDHWLRVP